ncbi:hypothetical protein M513_10541 [Trichuris suis]|uniref:Uncharacterized protein n=1 Tax=Trichuris suis TaxID=68888 RepID=A0A085LUG1_9BILA|nr:hypothetical protein M513_10541 [Trichuris suis]
MPNAIPAICKYKLSSASLTNKVLSNWLIELSLCDQSHVLIINEESQANSSMRMQINSIEIMHSLYSSMSIVHVVFIHLMEQHLERMIMFDHKSLMSTP